jgi:hypothetical protein
MNSKEKSKREQKEAEMYGGSEVEELYIRREEPNYCDKGGHMERSIFNNPKHLEHWKKINIAT